MRPDPVKEIFLLRTGRTDDRFPTGAAAESRQDSSVPRSNAIS